MRRPPALVVTGALLAVLGAALSCKTFDLPNETCNASKQHGGELTPPLSDTSCTRCLEDRCCDVVGVCERKDGCTAIVSGVHACVIGHGLAGAREEAACADRMKLAEAREADTAYRCMRDRCGGECGLPVCRVDPAALLIHNANCDGCFSSSCCPQLNACYASRACKLTIECIVKECGTAFGTTLTAGIANGAPDAGTGTFDGQRLCPTDGGTSTFGPPSCVQKCLCAFKDNDQGLAPEPSQRPVNLALAVYQCGVSAGCGVSCTDTPDAATP
jgi:hypothetical protein